MDKLKSRKFWMALITAIVLVANDGLNLNMPKESILTVAGVVMTYLMGQSYVDSKTK